MVNNSNWNSTRHKKVGHAEILACFVQHRSELWPGWAHDDGMGGGEIIWWSLVLATPTIDEKCLLIPPKKNANTVPSPPFLRSVKRALVSVENATRSIKCRIDTSIFVLFLHRTYVSVASNCSFDNSISIQPITTIHISTESLWKGQTFICGMCTTLN